MARHQGAWLQTAALAFIVTALASPAWAQSVWYVDDSAPGGGTGTSWTTPFKYLQDALAVAAPGSEIRVGGGTYRPDRDEAGNVTAGDRKATFQLRSGVVIRGGYAGYGASDPDQRDPATYVATLSGDLAGNDGPNFINNSENSFHIVVGSQTDASAVLDGFAIVGGNASNASDPNNTGSGGGLYIVSGSPTLVGCTFRDNVAAVNGGGLYNAFGSPLLTKCSFDNNRAASGGAVFNRVGSPSFDSCVFSHNSAADGGALRNTDNGSPKLNYCKLRSNTASGSGGAIFSTGYNGPILSWCSLRENAANYGGGLACRVGSPMLIHCNFEQNKATRYGGGVFSSLHAFPTIDACTFVGNQAASGAGFYHESDGNPLVSGCTFTQNIATAGGGGVCTAGTGAPTLGDCTFTGNIANWGGGMYNKLGDPSLAACTFSANQAAYGGGLMDDDGGEISVSNCTFVGNLAFDGGGLYKSGSGSPSLWDCTFRQNTAAHAGGGMLLAGVNGPGLIRCTFQQNTAVFEGGGLCLHDATSAGLLEGLFSGNVSYGSGGGVHVAGNASLQLANCRFIANTAATDGGAVHAAAASTFWAVGSLFNGNAALGGAGGAADASGTSVMMLFDGTVAANQAAAGGGLASGAGCYLWLTNSILWANSDNGGNGESAQVLSAGQAPVIDYCCVQGWTGNLGGAGNHGADPLFVDSDGSDGVPGNEDDDLRLAAGSACIDAGGNSAVPADLFDLDRDGDTSELIPLDLTGAKRFRDDPWTPDTGAGTPPLVDIGAYEFRPALPLGDLNCDGLVNFDDISPFRVAISNPSEYESAYPGCDIMLGDFNGDGAVNVGDVDAFVAALS